MKYPFNKERAMKGEPVVDQHGERYQFVKDDKSCDMNLLFKSSSGFSYYINNDGTWRDIKEGIHLFMLTPDPAPSAPIPFDLDKYNSGEWDAVYRDGSKPKGVYHIAALEVQQILTISDEGQTMWHYLTGEYLRSRTPHSFDLILAPKQVTRWFNLYKDHNGRLSVSASFDSEPTAKQADYVTGYISTYSFTTNAKP